MRHLKKLVVASVLAACSLQANAALDDVYDTTGGQHVNYLVSLYEANYIDLIGGVTYVDDQTFNDAGALYAKLTASPGFVNRFVQVPGTNRYLQAKRATRIYCRTNLTPNVTYVNWATFGGKDTYNDPGCVIFNTIKALAN